MGYRGSKSNVEVLLEYLFVLGLYLKLMLSVTFFTFVNEQRVDGSYLNDLYVLVDYMIFKLRCILMGLERVYQIKIPAKLSINLSITLLIFH